MSDVPTSCTEQDHDTTDFFCAACGSQLADCVPGDCSTCARGEHDSPVMPFCPCCGKRNEGVEAVSGGLGVDPPKENQDRSGVSGEGPKPYYRDEQVTLWHGDALEVARELPSGSADCCVTSPPYFGLRDYGIEGQWGLEGSPLEYIDRMQTLFRQLRRVLADEGTLWINIGDSYSGSWGNQGRKEERGTQRPINGEMFQPVHDGRYPTDGTRTGAIKPGAPPAKNLMGMPWRLAFALQNDGWILRNAIIWHKPNAMPESVTDRLSGRYEHVFLFSKSRKYWFDLDPIREPHVKPASGGLCNRTDESRWAKAIGDLDGRPAGRGSWDGEYKTSGRNPGDVWEIPTQPFSAAHFAVMPVQLAQRCISAGCKPGGTVIDPFSGSGTTGLAAQRLGRKYIGIDLNAEYLDLSLNTRLRQSALDFNEETA